MDNQDFNFDSMESPSEGTDDKALPTIGGTLIDANKLIPKYSVAPKVHVKVYDQSMIKYFSVSNKEWVDAGFDVIYLIDGERRTGKTTVGQRIAYETDPNFSNDNICFEIEDFNERIAKCCHADPKNNIYPQIILDESGYDLFSQDWMERLQKNFVKKFEVIGAKRVIVYFILPHRKFLNKGLREGMGRYWLHTTRMGLKRGLVECYESNPNKWELESFWKPLFAMFFDELAGDKWDAYQKKKMDFIEKVLHERGDKLDKVAYKLNKEYKWSQEKIGELFGVSGMMISKRVTRYIKTNNLTETTRDYGRQ